MHPCSTASECAMQFPMSRQAYVVDAICLLIDNQTMPATLIQSDKQRFEDGAIRQIKIWLVPEPVPPSAHRFKYSLVYVVDSVRVIGYDNERGKGDHRHLHGIETPYKFQGIAKLLADFQALIGQERGE